MRCAPSTACTLDRGFRATASVRLVGANIAGELVCTRGSFHDASDRALDAERITAEDIYLDDGFLIPGLDLREATYWWPDSSKRPWGLPLTIYTWVMIVFGWALATAVVAGITQMFRRR